MTALGVDPAVPGREYRASVVVAMDPKSGNPKLAYVVGVEIQRPNLWRVKSADLRPDVEYVEHNITPQPVSMLELTIRASQELEFLREGLLALGTDPAAADEIVREYRDGIRSISASQQLRDIALMEWRKSIGQADGAE